MGLVQKSLMIMEALMSSLLSSVKNLSETFYTSYDRVQTATEPYEIPILAAIGVAGIIASAAGVTAPTESSFISENLIRPTYQPFFDAVGLRPDTVLAEGDFAATGINLFTQGRAAIKVRTRLFNVDRGAFGFVMKHEVGHIINNDALVGVTLHTAVTLGLYYLTKNYFTKHKCAKAFAIGIVALTGLTLTKRYLEGKADDFAIRHSTDDELKGGRRFFLAAQSAGRIAAGQDPIFTTADGDDRLAIFHPSRASRIAKVEAALFNKGLPLERVSPDEKYDLLCAMQPV